MCVAEQIKVGLVADRSATFNKHLSGQQGGGGAGAGGGEALEREEGHSEPRPLVLERASIMRVCVLTTTLSRSWQA